MVTGDAHRSSARESAGAGPLGGPEDGPGRCAFTLAGALGDVMPIGAQASLP